MERFIQIVLTLLFAVCSMAAQEIARVEYYYCPLNHKIVSPTS